MRRLLQATLTIALVPALPWLDPTPQSTAFAGEKKVEVMREKGEFTSDTPRDKVKKDCPGKLYVLKCVEGRTYTIDLRSDDFDAFLRLEDSTGKQVAEDDDSGGGSKGQDARIIFTAPKTANYTICATSFNSDAKGKYTLNVDSDTKGKDVSIEYMLDVKAKLTKDDAKDPTRGGNCYCKTYKIEMKPKMTYIIELDSKDFDAYIRLVNDEGKQVAYDDDGAKVGLNAKLIYPCDKAGTYTIFATSFNEAETGEFSLRVSSQETKEKEKKGK
jgi:serine protease Do